MRVYGQVDERVSVEIDEAEVLREISNEALLEEIKRRDLHTGIPTQPLLERVYLHFRQAAAVPDCLREYIYAKLGRVL